MQTPSIIIIAHNMRSAHNVGSLLRTAEGIGAETVLLSGYSPHPSFTGDVRLQHLARKQTIAISKTALGAEKTQKWKYISAIDEAILFCRQQDYVVVGLEQGSQTIPLPDFIVPSRVAIVLGEEVAGLHPTIQSTCDFLVEIPMHGSKESFNVVQAAAMMLYHCRFWRH